MCHFITMVAPKGTEMDLLKSELKKCHREVLLVENRHVNKRLKSGEIYFAALPKFCDCGTALGSANKDAEELDDYEERQQQKIAKLKRKGWSETKINRWLDESEKTSIKKEAKEALSDGLGEWPDVIRGFLDHQKVSYIGILLHMYHAGLDTSPQVYITQDSPVRWQLRPPSISYERRHIVCV